MNHPVRTVSSVKMNSYSLYFILQFTSISSICHAFFFRTTKLQKNSFSSLDNRARPAA
ncbi:hypothetical protein I656_02105 [Geobacillus sp. WSUCF1]|nr:hypothetical protein I656_02105 [Geobacillus sp. WSUCF1]